MILERHVLTFAQCVALHNYFVFKPDFYAEFRPQHGPHIGIVESPCFDEGFEIVNEEDREDLGILYVDDRGQVTLEVYHETFECGFRTTKLSIDDILKKLETVTDGK